MLRKLTLPKSIAKFRKNFVLIGITFLLMMFHFSTEAQITGVVFRDFNGNGVQDDNEPLIEGVLVKAYDATGEECGNTMTTNVLTGPNYELEGCGDVVVRVEFTIPQEYCVSNGIDYSGFSGDVYGSSVQFTTGNASDINFAIQNPGDYNQGSENTFVYTARHANGDPLAGGTSASESWFVGFPYTHSGTMSPTYAADGSIIGPVWGSVYSKQAGKIFTSALMKRHTGFGVLGSGGIYLLEPDGDTFIVETFYDLDANGHRTRAAEDAPEYGEGSSFELVGSPSATVNYLGANDPLSGLPSGFGVIGTNVERGLLADKAEPNHDPAAFDQVGKVGLGAMQISEDGKFLFVVNLYSRLLFRLELDDAANPTEVINVTSYALPALSCNNGVLRPFGLKYHRNNLYVGAVCSGENGGENIVDGNSDLEGFVFQLINPTAAAQFVATPVISIPLNYRKGKARTGFPENDQWYPWTNNSDILNATSDATPPSRGSYAQPILSDIDFSDRGDLIVAFMDRGGHQWGHQNRRFLGNSEQLVRYQLGGDILIAGKNCETGVFDLENNGSFISSGQQFTSGGEDNNQGPGGGEFFFREISEEIHQETHMGSIATLPGQDRVLNAVMNPLVVFSGGTVLYSTSDGLNSNEYQIYGSENLMAGTLGKANGLGDISFSLEVPPIEIGNYVWLDSNGDGIQTADESGIDGVTVELYKENELVGTTETSNGGQYYFNNTNVILGGESGLLPFMDYEIRIPFNQAPIEDYNLTLTNVPPIGGSLADHSDNDGIPGPGYAFIQITTGIEGANNHTYDFGFQNICPDPIVIGLQTEDVSVCDGSDGSITISGLDPSTSYNISYFYNGSEVGPLVLEANGEGEIILDGLSVGTYTLVTVNLEDCTTTDFTELIILDPETPVFEVVGINPEDCIGGNGIINISGLNPNQIYGVAYDFEGEPQGPFNLSTNGEGVIILMNLVIGTYSNFTVTLNDCIGEVGAIIDFEFPDSPTFTIDFTQPTVCDDSDGTISILGLEPDVIYEVSYKYNGLDQGPFNLEADMSGIILLTGLPGGIYTEISVALNSCETSFSGQVLLVEPEGPEFEVSSIDPTVCDDSDGVIIISGLVPQLEYLVSYDFNGDLVGPQTEIADGNGSITIPNLGAGTYNNIRVSLDGCETINNSVLELVEPDGPDFTVSSGSPTDCEEEDGFILINGLMNFFEYQVSYRKDNMIMGPFNMSSNESGEILIDNLSEGMYSDVTVSLDGCETVLEELIMLNDPDGPEFVLSFQNPIDCIESDGLIVISGLMGETEYFISYNYNGVPFGPQEYISDNDGEILLSNLEPGTYNSISVALMNCELTSMQVIILNEPEAPAVDAGDFQQVCIGTEIVIQATNPDGALISWDGGIIDGQPITLDVGFYTFTVTATLNGCEATDQVSIQVIPDEVTLNCQDVFYNLTSGLCGTTISLNINAMDGCVPGGADDYIIEYVSGVQTGDYLEGGEYTSTWQLIDPEGNVVDECTINVFIIPFEGSNVTLVCNDLVNVSIGVGCLTEITADMILEGSGYNCYEEYIVTIAYPQIPGINTYPNTDFPGANIIDHTHVGLTLVVYITDPVTGNTCWGRIKIEDKLPPLLECENLQFPCTDNYANNRDPRGNQIVFPSNLFWPRDFRSTASDLSIAINQRKFTVLANIIDCTEVTLTYTDSVINGDCEDEDGIFRTVIRSWVAKDAYGNTSSCDQIITFTTLTIDELLDELNLEPMLMVGCNETIPEIITGPVTCNIWFGLNTELQLPLCGDGEHSYKLFRTYTIFDDCTGEMRDFSQVIVVKDDIPPVIVNCSNGQLPTRRVAVQSFGCNAEVVLLPPVVLDNCSDEISVVPSIPNVQLTFVDGTWRAWLGLGTTYNVVWTAYDECGNSSSCTENIIVEDKNPPVAVCIEYTKVSLTAQIQQDGTYEAAFARVFANSFDNGSYDNCEIFDFKVMRMSNTTITRCGQTHNTSENPPLGSVFNPLSPNAPYWSDYIDLCCEDLALDEPIMVVLRVRDIYGNVNYCMVNVEVESKIPPTLTGPANVTIDCRDIQAIDDLIVILTDRDLSIAQGFGWANLSSLCEEELRVTVTASLTECGVTDMQNRVRRTFSAGTGANTRSVTQEIFVINETPFRILNVQPGGLHNRIDDIVWPINLDLPSCNEAYDIQSLKERYNETGSTFFDFAELGESTRPRSMPFLRPVACSIPGMGYDDWEFELEGGCIKIIRRWKIIDWCQIDPETGTYRQWMYDQVIRVLDSAPAVFEQVTVRLTNAGVVDDESVSIGCPTGLITLEHTAENCTPALSFALEASDDCSKLQNITYTYRLTVGSGANSFVPTSTVVSGGGNVNAAGQFGFNFGNFGPEFQNVVHRIRWTLDDRCGNVTVCEFEFRVRDGKKPSPICTDEIIAVLMPSGGMISLNASIFNVASFDNCAGELRYTFNAPFGQSGALQARIFDCDDYVNNYNAGTLQSIITLPVFVTDASGNFDFCTVRVQLQDNEGVCDDVGSIVIRGQIESSRGEILIGSDKLTINGFKLYFNSDMEYSLRIPDMSATDLPYVITPERNDNPLNGVSTLDIVLIQRHILGQTIIDNPYERIAADINGDGKINALDIMELRQLVLLKRTDFTGKNAGLSWKFVDKDYKFLTGYPEGEDYSKFIKIRDELTLNNNDFVAIKIGDINTNASFIQGVTEERAVSGVKNILVRDSKLQRGEVAEIQLVMEEPSYIDGYQLSVILVDNLEILEVENPELGLNEYNFGIFKEEGLITASWHGNSNRVNELLNIKVRVLEDVELRDAVRFSNSIDNPSSECYDSNLETSSLSLKFVANREATAQGYDLLQNEPNPFRNETKINFLLPMQEKVKIEVFSGSGQIVKVIEGTYPGGWNTFFLSSAELGNAGIFYYTLSTANFQATRKMIIIR